MNAYSALGENEILQQLDKLGIQRAMIDTGAGTSLGPVQDNALLSNKYPVESNSKLVAVGQQAIHGDPQGNLKMYVLPDLGNQVEENGARIERELQLLHTEPSASGRPSQHYTLSARNRTRGL